MSEKKTVAVTGAGGFIGSRLVDRLAQSDHVDSVIALDCLPLEISYPKVRTFQRDIGESTSDILRKYRVDAVVHLAFLLRPGHDRKAAHRVNVSGTTQVINDCRDVGIKHLVYLSSTTVYGARCGTEQAYTEESPVRPVRGFQYAEDKAAAELKLRTFAINNPSSCVTILRGCTVMAPQRENFVTEAFFRLASVRVLGADPQMQFIHLDDLIDAFELCLLKPASGVFNITGEGTVAYSEIASIAGRRAIALPAPLLAFITWATWIMRLQSDSPACGIEYARWPWVVSNEKLARETGFRPKHTSREALVSSVLAGS
ncbi:MAG: NAD-dependent epimerase/dehydratase family protein [Candidatus Dadabacteria bacterium]|nr:NAD-dependent epimerase/dehydratase family protein [Candidatus Dadabacteria bacterium]MDE0520027.1 NAD-dependent epimerase/dehydratase family protein [Candidatus Dadabacteria bacterium]MDE0663659.1 NAD-dependent epimerase/dehydratase family protein [Candidatus Dadabacteria bacterium]